MSSVEWLADAPGTIRDVPVFGSDHPIREMTRKIAFGGEWTAESASMIRGIFDSMAPSWAADHDVEERQASIVDALDRGGVAPGRIVELGCGSGSGTSQLAARGFDVVALDLSLEMLLQAPAEAASWVQGDSSCLPFAAGSAPALQLVNMLLFPQEIDRVLQPDGALIWVNTIGEETPIHLPPEDVVAALPGSWTAIAGRAGTGLWCVAHRA